MKKEDKVFYQALLKLLNDGTFELKAREVPTFLKVYNWVQDIPNRWIQQEEDVKEEAGE